MNFRPLNLNFSQPAPAFPLEYLPEIISQYVSSVAQVLQVPVGMAATSVLAVCATALQGKYCIQATPNWTEPLNLYCAIVGPPSDRKSAVIAEVTRPIHTYVREYNTKHAEEISLYNSRHKILTDRIAKLEKQLSAPHPKGSIDDLASLQRDLINLEKNPVSKLHIIYDDVTPESMAAEMAANHGHIAIMSGEGGIIGMLSGRYSAFPNLDLFLKAYTGEYYVSSRIGRAGDELNHPLLTMLLGLQPTALETLINDQNFRGRGLTARFIYCYPNSLVGSRTLQVDPIDFGAKSKYESCIYNLLKIADINPDSDTARTLKLDHNAYCLFQAFYDDIEKQLPIDLRDINAWGGRICGNALRIAGIMHCATYQADAINYPISTDTIYNATTIMRYYIDQAQKVFNISQLNFGNDINYLLAKLCRDYIPGSLQHTITRRDLQRLCRKKSVLQNYDYYTSILQDHGVIAIQVRQSSGPPTETYIVNPAYLHTLDC